MEEITLTQRFSKAMSKKNIKKSELASKYKISRQLVNNFFTSQKSITDSFAKVCIGENININWLLSGKGEMFLNPEKNESKEKNSVEIDEEVLDIFKLVYKRAMKTNKINLLEECLLECRQKIK